MIAVQYNKTDFEYDIYSLIKEFYPREEIRVDTAPFPEEASLRITVVYGEQEISLTAAGEWEELEKLTPEQRTRRIAVEYDRSRPDTKSALKKILYELLTDLSGREQPWGDLTGIRPTKIPMQWLREGLSEDQIRRKMKENYFVSDRKTELALDIARREKRLLDDLDYRKGYSLYIGIPFCPSICLYCSFSSSPLHVWKDRVDDYVTALCREIDQTVPLMEPLQLQTIYMGGGTPTTLSPEQMDRVLTHVEDRFDLSGVREFTVEAGRPDSITKEKLEVLRRHGIDRISINPQTMNQKTLDLIGRHHTVEEIRECFSMARSLGFTNINADLIVGLPGEGMDEVAHTMEEIRALAPESVTVHSLALKRAARLSQMWAEYGEISFMSSDRIMEHTGEVCAQMGLVPYYLYRQKNMAGNFENVGYALPGQECLYNILIMEEVQSILALGAGASTKIIFPDEHIERVENVKDIRSYLERTDEMIARKSVIPSMIAGTWKKN
ncbi:MAG: coproporphyrinogen dehydrogenase HemZ [Lachnospiraceae bacterium]|nr:coproporphyrinogen dehydrogenase HemZ [Lachnospiraceae bacterium]